jgi:hypothetical protein
MPMSHRRPHHRSCARHSSSPIELHSTLWQAARRRPWRGSHLFPSTGAGIQLEKSLMHAFYCRCVNVNACDLFFASSDRRVIGLRFSFTGCHFSC